MVSRGNFEKILIFSALLIVSALFLFPIGDAKADNIVATDADKTITFDAASAGGSVDYKIEATSAVGDTPGCNTGPGQPAVIVNLYVGGSLLSASSVPLSASLVSPPSLLPMSFTNCKQQRTVAFTSATAGTYVVTAVATGGTVPSFYQTESATMTVIVLQNDVTPPTVTVPADITGVEATSPAGATVTFVSSASDLVSGPLPTTCIPPSGSTFPIGTTPVTCSATDGAGNIGSASFTVTVVDTTDPQIFVPVGPLRPLGISINSDSTNKDVGYLVTATDISSTPSIICVGDDLGATVTAIGGNFPIGKTRVTCTATDGAGRQASGSFDVLVGRTEITAPIPSEIKWDKTFDVSVLTHGFESGNPLTDDSIEIRRADNGAVIGSVTTSIGDPDGKTFTVPGLTLPKADSNTSVGLVAVLVDNPDVASSSTFPISVLKHVTSLSLDPISDAVVTTAFGTRGALKDVDASGAGIPGQAITFEGSGVTTGVNGLLQPVTTAGVLITGPGGITFCPTGPDCSPNPGSVDRKSVV